MFVNCRTGKARKGPEQSRQVLLQEKYEQPYCIARGILYYLSA